MSVSDGDVDMDVNAALPAACSSDDDSLPMAGGQQGGVLRDWSDARLERVASYTTTTMRLKPDKWSKMMANDSFRVSTLPLSLSLSLSHTLHLPPVCSASCWTGCTAGVGCSS